ncbi:phosphoglycolate phosphatase [Vibrio sp. JC009]|uniref:phosphoglycolate phosphatase n=1 Tax=Vibrio sp. JC009 TaxID=2912314 RepID=UPI0023B18D0D|nr:phosphoglycolate phosphatase [Vibrio sp. JC009]WED21625.1 phosphoglycolate phosphatase [Vibrio sp. JC009]
MSDKIKLIAFDLDGTLLNSVPDLTLAVDKAVQTLGYEAVTEAQVGEWVGNGADILIARAISRSLTVDPELDPELRQKGRDLFNRFYAECGHTLSHLYETVFETLNTLYQAGYKLAVVTNKPSMFVPEILEQQKINELFVDVIGGEDFPKRKPDPMALNWLLEKHGLTADEMLMVGDSRNDILAAKNAGCPSFALTYGYNHGEPISDSNPDYVADRLAEILDILPTAEQS